MGTVAVYCDFSTVDEALLARLEDYIAPHIPAEKKPMKDESVCARALLKYVLSEYFSVDKFTLQVKENGKPCLSDCHLHFNLSHCRNRVICAVSEFPIGCDVQDIRPFNSRIVSRFFSSDEGMILSASKSKDKHFSKLWVLKESILKYKGDGITGGLDSYGFAEYLESNSFSAYGVNLKSFNEEGFIYGVCAETDEITVFKAEIKDVIKKISYSKGEPNNENN